MSYIYRYEAMGIQKWILATDRLKEIKGASAIVEGLTGLLEKSLGAQGAGGELIVGAAGGATVRFPDEEAAVDFASIWPWLVQQQAPGLAVAQGWVPEEAGEGTFFDRLAAQLRSDRNRIMVDLPEAGPCIARAPRSGLPSLPGEALRKGESLEDPGTRARREASSGEQESMLQRVWEVAGAGSPPKVPYSLDDLPRLAVLVADGNDLGLRIQSFSDSLSPDQFQEISHFIEKTTCQAIVHATEEVFTDGDVLMRPVLVGGDDVSLLLPADRGWEFARAYLNAFELASDVPDSPFGGKLTVSAGVAFVGGNHPFHLAFDLAQDLCKTAKKRVRAKDGGATPSGVLFHRVTTALTGSYDQIIDRELSLSAEGADGSISFLSQGPYLLHPSADQPGIDALDQLLGALKKIPRGTLREAMEALFISKGLSRNRIERMQQTILEQYEGKKIWDNWVSALAALGCSDQGWASNPEGDRTPLVDAQVLISENSMNREVTPA